MSPRAQAAWAEERQAVGMSIHTGSLTPSVPAAVRGVGATLVLALASAGSWWGWLAWDETYQTDPVTGVASGPYEGWQVVGCVLSLLVVALVAHRVLGPVAVTVTMTVCFTLAYAATAVPTDETGLAMVGVLMVAAGLGTVSTLVAAGVVVVRGARRSGGDR